MSTKAVVFTHCGSLKYTGGATMQRELPDAYAKMFFEPYLKCRVEGASLLGIVYVYVDWAVVETVHRSPDNKIPRKVVDRVEQEEFEYAGSLLQGEKAIKGMLRIAESRIRRRLNLIRELPIFSYVGLEELIPLLNNLVSVQPDYADYIHSRIGDFSYDSPKFVEAVIRLARGDIPRLASNPVIRIDEDARVNPEQIELMIEAFDDSTMKEPFFFFSGRYGREDERPDVINDYAVRTHWFFVDAPGVRGDATGCPMPPKPGDARFADGTWEREVQLAEMFLWDLSVLGAAQPIPDDRPKTYSIALQELLNSGGLREQNRPDSQVVSGAGLIMSRRAIELLPPFTNFGKLVTWIDDHLKRRLHETMRDLYPDDVESVNVGGEGFAKVQQERPWIDARDRDEGWPRTTGYFKCLLRGCIFHAIITSENVIEGENGESRIEPNSFSEMVKEIAWFKRRELTKNEKTQLISKMKVVALRRCDQVLRCWRSEEFHGTLSYEWAETVAEDVNLKEKVCDEVIQGASAYLDLLFCWPAFTRAISRMPFPENDWIYLEVD